MPTWIQRIFRRPDPARVRPAASVFTPDARDEQRKRLGRKGENAAVARLQRNGYRILERNYLARGGEVDIIAEHKGVIVFVEVKTRSPRAWASPESAVTPEKMARVLRAALQYLAPFRDARSVRYEAVTIMTDQHDRITSLKIDRYTFDGDVPANEEEG